MREFRTGIDVVGQPIARVASPSNATDAANKGYVDAAVGGLAWKQPVRAASTANVTLSSVTAGSTLDGVALAAGDRVLLKDQTTASQNGIYVIAASGAPSRATDADSTSELQSASVFVIAGTVNKDRNYTQNVDDPTVGTTALVWAQFGSGSTITPGDGLSQSGSTLSVKPKPGGGVVVDGTGVALDPTFSGFAKRYAATLPAGQTSTPVTHNLGTTDLTVQVQDIAGAAPYLVDLDVVYTSVNVITIVTPVAVTANQYRILITG